MRRLCIASRNPHKLLEIRDVLAGLPLQVTSAADYPGCPEVEEDGATLEANAAKKGRWVCGFTGLLTLADDTGLEVEALGGEPGVRSARWAGPGCSYADNNVRLLRELAGVPAARRTARFRCVVALAEPGPGWGVLRPDQAAGPLLAQRAAACLVTFHEGRIEGRILEAPRGESGFGYDPLFWIPELGRTLAELSLAEKNRISHRALALAAVRADLTRR